MVYNLLVNRTIWIFGNPKMTMVIGVAVALGVSYACVAPWFYCNPNTPEEELQTRSNEQETAVDASTSNQTLTSTNIRITGLGDFNFVSIKFPNQLSVSKMSNHNLEVAKQLVVPEIHISSASGETTVYPLSSKASTCSQITGKSSRIHRVTSIDSNHSKWDIIRSHDVDNKNLTVRRMSQLKIKKPRARSSNPPSSNSIIRNQDSRSSLSTLNSCNTASKTNRIHQRKNSNSSKLSSEIVGKESLCDRTRRHSLYPDVKIIVRTNSSSTTIQSASNVHQESNDIIEEENLVFEQPISNQKIMESHSPIADQFSSSVKSSERILQQSRNKSISNFFMKKCKKFWVNSNRNNCENSNVSKLSIVSNEKNNPTHHSTSYEKSNLEVHEYLDKFNCESEMRQDHWDCHGKTLNVISKNTDTYRRHCSSQKISCCLVPNLHETTQTTINTPSTFSNVTFQSETTHNRSLPSQKNFECINDEPLDLSIKSKTHQTNINRENNSHSNSNSELSKFTMKKCASFNLFKPFNNKKSGEVRKCKSLPDKNKTNILKSISYFCHRSQENENENETMRTHLDDSTVYPELKPINGVRHSFPSGSSST